MVKTLHEWQMISGQKLPDGSVVAKAIDKSLRLVLRRIAELANGQSDALAQLDVELYSSQPILV